MSTITGKLLAGAAILTPGLASMAYAALFLPPPFDVITLKFVAWAYVSVLPLIVFLIAYDLQHERRFGKTRRPCSSACIDLWQPSRRL